MVRGSKVAGCDTGRSVQLTDGCADVPAGKIASVVTSLQMFEQPFHRPESTNPSWTLRRVAEPSLDWYRDLFHRVGDDWLWFSRLQLTDRDLMAIIRDPSVEIYAVRAGGCDEGLLELDCRIEGECELAFLGLTAPLLGKGAGRWLMNRALEIAWSKPIARLWLHTCTLDHPSALAFYQRTGFVAFRRQIEVSDDPRVIGLVPGDACPQVAVLGGRESPRSDS